MNREPALIITSAAYVAAEFAAEFGRLPPAMLPLASRRLYEHQLAACRGALSTRVLSLPEDYTLDAADADRLCELGVEVVHVPDGLTLADSLLFVLASARLLDRPLRVLHGDTLIQGLDFSMADVFSVATTSAYYPWAEFTVQEDGVTRFSQGLWRPKETPVVSGYFAFEDYLGLARALTGARGDFVEALNLYAANHSFRPVQTGTWHDLGHLQTYFRARSRMTSERAFNALSAGRGCIRKSGDDSDKLRREALWFDALPSALRKFVPQLLETADRLENAAEEPFWYDIEYLPLPTLSDLWVFGRLPPMVWTSIFEACDAWFQACAHCVVSPVHGGAGAAMELLLPKTLRRLDTHAASTGLDLDQPWIVNGVQVPGVRQIAEETAAAIRPVKDDELRIVHGDFCFSNILYDHRGDRVKLIDPRGGDAPGDLRYDVAKLHHSVIGGYDQLVAGRFCLREPSSGTFEFHIEMPNGMDRVAKAFQEFRFAGSIGGDSADVAAMAIHLFLSMLPLHADSPSRQQAFLVNALRLYARWRKNHVAQ